MTNKLKGIKKEDQYETMLRADEHKIKWLFENYSGYRIAKESGVSQPLIARLINGTRELKNVSFETASKLNQCAERLIKDDFKDKQ